MASLSFLDMTNLSYVKWDREIMKKTSIVLLSAALSGMSLGGEAKVALASAPEADWSWCSIYDQLGKPVYDNPDNPLFQYLKFSGRAQLQYAYVDGEGVDGEDFSEDFEEIRRLRIGGELRMLKYFKLKGGANIISDGKPSGGDRDFGYQSLGSLLLSVDIRKAFGVEAFDKVVLSYGRHKVKVGEEAHESSKKIKTVERSAVANKLYPTRATGVSLDLAKGNWSGTAAIFSTDASDEFADWNDGLAYYLSSTFERENGDQVILDFLYNDANGNADNELGDKQGFNLYEWAVSAAYVAKRDRLEVMVNTSYGDNGSQSSGGGTRDGNFWGLVIIPSYWLVEDKWEAVARYSYQGSDESNGIRTNSRYARRDHGGEVNSGRGDEHHSIYAGLNYYLCGHKSKIMTGIEYETLDTGGGEVDASTLWLAYRAYF